MFLLLINKLLIKTYNFKSLRFNLTNISPRFLLFIYYLILTFNVLTFLKLGLIYYIAVK